MAFNEKKHIHFMGICGTAMASLAGLMKSLGHRVTGSDQNVYPPMSTQLASLGISIQEGYKKENLKDRPDLVIVGNVIRKDYEEAQALLNSDIPYTSLPKAIGEYVIEDRHSIVISGTHGKTTTTSMMSWVVDQCGLQPGFMIGGIPKNFEYSFRAPKGNYFVIEGDEYDTAFFDKVPKFIHYKPKSVILTSVEFDHVDIYRDIDHVKEAFVRLMNLIPADGNLVYYADGQEVCNVIQKSICNNKISYGFESGDLRPSHIKYKEESCFFEVEYLGKKYCDVELSVFGKHNILNALSVLGLSKLLGLKLESVLMALKNFEGVKRRQEILGKPNGVTLIEDFAHHPTAVSVTLESLRERYQDSKVIALFEPRSATSRRNVFQAEYETAFSKADIVILSDVYNGAHLEEKDRLSIPKIVKSIDSMGKKAFQFSSTDDMVSCVKKYAKPGDVVVVMSNGAFGGIYQKLLKRLEDGSAP